MISVKLYNGEREFVTEELYTNQQGLQYLYEIRRTHTFKVVKIGKVRGWLHVYAVEKSGWLESLTLEERHYFIANRERGNSPLYSPDGSPSEQVLVYHE